MHAYLIIAHDQFELLESLLNVSTTSVTTFIYISIPIQSSISAGSKAFCKTPALSSSRVSI